MSITLENTAERIRPESSPTLRQSADATTAAAVGQRLRGETTAVRVHIRWLGTRKSLSQSQRQLVANTFDADTSLLSAAKKLIDTSHPAVRTLTNIRNQACAYWRGETLPYVEPGVRLLRRSLVTDFDAKMHDFRSQLLAAVAELQSCYDDLVHQARDRLGNLFDASDYPVTLEGLFELQWDYPSCSTPDYLRSVSPEVYEAECQRVRERFDEAVRLAESAFAEELHELVSHLTERLSGDEDGKPKVFRDTAVTNLLEFFDRFQRLNIRSDEQLDAMVEQARGVIRGVAPQQLRDHAALSQHVREQLGRVSSSLDTWMTDRPRRNILRRPH